jgi:tape measure domain-containing protein
VAVASVDIQVNSQGAVRNLNQVSAASKATASAVDGVRNAVTGLVGAFTVVSTLKFVFAKTAELETQTRSLQVLTGSVQQAKSIIQELQQLGAVTPFTSTELIDTAKRLNAFGVEGDKVVETTRRLADVAGATGAELQGLATAYGQVQAKGRLQGEELLQFQERGVALQEELRKMYGLTGDEFQKALSKGRISAEAVEVAVKRLTDAGGKYANGAIAQSDTLQGKFSTLTDGVEQLARTIGVVLTPALKAIFNQAIQVVDAINAALAAGRGGGFARNLAGATGAINLGATSEGVDRIAKGIGQVSSQRNKAGIQQNLQYLSNYQAVLQRIGAEDPNASRAVQLQGVIQQKIQQNLAAQQQLNKAQAGIFKPAAIPALLGETGGGKKKKGKSDAERAAERAAKEAAKEAERVAQVIRDRLAEGQILRVKSGLQDKISAAEVDNDKMLAARLQGLQKEIDIQYQYAQALAQEKDVLAQEAIIFEGNSKLVANQRDVQRELGAIQRQREQEGLQSITAYLEKQYELNTAIQQQKALAESISTTLGQGMTSVFDLLIQGSDNWGKSLQQIASKVLVDIANQLIRIYVIEQAVSAIKSFLSPALPFGGGGGQIGGVGTLGPNYGIKQFANGGVPPVGRPSLVGERGPELFMPGIRGTVIPNGGFGGSTNVVVNVDASGNSNVQGDQAQAKQLGVAVSAAVQAELVKQQRPGGLLSGTRR